MRRTILALFVLAGCTQAGDTENAAPTATWEVARDWRPLAECIGYQMKQPPAFSAHSERATINPSKRPAAFGGIVYPWIVTVAPSDAGATVELRQIDQPLAGTSEATRERAAAAVSACQR